MTYEEQKIIDCALNIRRLERMCAYVDLKQPSRPIVHVCRDDVAMYQRNFELEMHSACDFVLLDRSDVRPNDVKKSSMFKKWFRL